VEGEPLAIRYEPPTFYFPKAGHCTRCSIGFGTTDTAVMVLEKVVLDHHVGG